FRGELDRCSCVLHVIHPGGDEVEQRVVTVAYGGEIRGNHVDLAIRLDHPLCHGDRTAVVEGRKVECDDECLDSLSHVAAPATRIQEGWRRLRMLTAISARTQGG